MAVTIVVHGFAQSSNAVTVTTAGADTTGSKLITVGVVDDTPATSTMFDSNGNIWSPLMQKSTPSSFQCQMFYCQNPIVGAGHTFTVTANSGNSFPAVSFIAFTGTAAVSPFDGENGVGNAGVFTSVQPGAVSPNFDGEVIVTLNGTATATTIPTIDSGFTRSDGALVSAGVAYGITMGYLIQGAKASVNPTWSWTTNDNAVATIATFKAQPQIFLKDVFSSQAMKRAAWY